MEGNDDIKYMRRCLELASGAAGMTYPNPMVGSVIVHNGLIIGEGYHLKAGLPHAEVNAINSVSDKSKLKESTLYVNLEPCSHFGKTPPCADLIIECSIPKVVIGSSDTSDKVNGSGIERLRKAGCEVVTGVLESESRWLNRRFFSFSEKKRPYIILKWAESSDGFIDVKRENTGVLRPTWISGKPERVLVHKWRSEEQSILVGAGTVRADNPQLNVRLWKGRDPMRLVLSGRGDLTQGHLVQDSNENVIFFTHNEMPEVSRSNVCMLNRDEPSCIQIAKYLYMKGIQSLFVEGGAEVLSHFISNGLWDEARVFTGKYAFHDGIEVTSAKGLLCSEEFFEGSSLHVYINENVKDL
jgi:diaminohydroxyphosphoribosylaminopyrimidine deaminase/5-amino-6-(5-phosphoribosylamino)uracil reductase